MTDRVVVSQLGARMHYAVPRILDAAGELERFYTDICADQGWPSWLRSLPPSSLPPAVRRLCGRVTGGVAPQRVTSFPLFGLRLAKRRMAARTPSEQTATALWAAPRFARLVIRHGFGGATGFYGFSGDSLEQLLAAREAGLWTVAEQIIAPRTLLDRLLEEEEAAFPDWRLEQERDRHAREFGERERAEWDAADLVVCGSEFVFDAVEKASGGSARCLVVPYGVDQRFTLPPRPPRQGRLRVLTIGATGLRKGTPYVLKAACQLADKVTFRLVGPCGVPDAVRAALDEALELFDAVPRAEILAHYAWADVFLLPSLCEGSATVVYEALAAGLPVVTTANSGSVVRDGLEGFIVPIRSSEAIVSAIERLDGDRALLAELSANAALRAAGFDITSYGRRLRMALRHAHNLHRDASPAPLRRSGDAAATAGAPQEA
jgi:glycosyltransferase involved in cell wall biosynthesis